MFSMGHNHTMNQGQEGKQTVEAASEGKETDTLPSHTALQVTYMSSSLSIGDCIEVFEEDKPLEESIAMLNVGSLMREQDAELLESIHMSGGYTGTTPVLKVTDSDHIVSPLVLSRPAPQRGASFLLGMFQEPDSEASARDSCKLDTISNSQSTSLLWPQRAETSMLDLIRPPSLNALSRRALSGEIFQNDDSKPVDESRLPRIESKERRINEAAQFAEAVGDLPLQEQKSLRIIDDGDDAVDADDDDDDATEIRVARRGMGPPVLSKRSLHNEVESSHGHHRTESALSHTELDDQKTSDLPETPVQSRHLLNRPQRTVSMGDINAIESKAPSVTDTSVRTANSSTDSFGRNATFLAQLPSSMSTQDFVYKGIKANPPEIVKRGTTRGNYAQLHRKAWLEVSDKYHRYGKHLRMYYRFWEKIGCPTNFFFDWLDSKGEAAGQPLPEIPECPRSELDSDTVLYITNPEVTQNYALKVVADSVPEFSDGEDAPARGRIFDVYGDPVVTGPDGWIFVLRDNVMYGSQKVTSVAGHSKERFHHSSFFGGKAVASAGIFITDDDGYLTRLYPHSGHYRPGEAHVQRILFYLFHEGVDLRTFEMDMQQVLHVSRDQPPSVKSEAELDQLNEGGEVKSEKKKKVESLFLMSAVVVACFLANKARFIGEGIFSQIHQIRRADVATVTEALEAIDGGGYWRKRAKELKSRA